MPKLFAHCHVKTITLRIRDNRCLEESGEGWPTSLYTNMPVNMHKVAMYRTQEAKTTSFSYDSKEIRPAGDITNSWGKVEPWKSAPACLIIGFFTEKGSEITRWYFESESDRAVALYALDYEWSNDERAEQND